MDSRTINVTLHIEGDAALYQCSAIEHEGEVWLVPKWIPSPSEGYALPERMISLRRYRHQMFENRSGDLLINIPVPRALIDGPLSPELGVRDPQLKFRSSSVYRIFDRVANTPLERHGTGTITLVCARRVDCSAPE
jgi:hypothetical protein